MRHRHGDTRRTDVMTASTALAEALELHRRQCGTIDVSMIAGASGSDEALVASVHASGFTVEVLHAHPAADEPLAVALNHAGRVARGCVLVVLLPDLDATKTQVGAVAACLTRLRDLEVGLWQVGSVIAVSCALWVALDGLEAAYDDIGRSVADLHQRARALGYGADGAPRGERRHSDRRFAIYTAITGRYDRLKRQSAQAAAGARQVAFVDEETRRVGGPAGWELCSITQEGTDANRMAKHPKVLSHRVLPDADCTLWMDASVLLIAPFDMARLTELFLADSDLCVFGHDRRGCVYEEARRCIELGLDEPETIVRQMARYRDDGFPVDAGLAEATVILRRHTPEICAFNERWWQEIERGSRRDQLSFPYVAHKMGLSYHRFPLSLGMRNGLFMKIARSPDPKG
jgi:hypothetical protein